MVTSLLSLCSRYLRVGKNQNGKPCMATLLRFVVDGKTVEKVFAYGVVTSEITEKGVLGPDQTSRGESALNSLARGT